MLTEYTIWLLTILVDEIAEDKGSNELAHSLQSHLMIQSAPFAQTGSPRRTYKLFIDWLLEECKDLTRRCDSKLIWLRDRSLLGYE